MSVVAAKALTSEINRAFPVQNKIQYIMEKSHNYFTLFDMPVTFDIDLPELTQRYLKLQKAIHPDKFSNAAEQERVFSVQQTALLNDAYDTLKKPLLRARYLLELNGVCLNDEKNTIMDSDFLMQQMELREAIEKAKSGNADIDVLEETIDHIDDLYNAKLQIMKKLFAVPEPVFEHIADVARKLQFFSKLREEADSLAAKLADH